ncbi:MAG: hypothetical protein LBQ66_15455 [Planctomycetaceae bacterium]|nr:hypothetical protein [Planctomycetaceae bacterium]
MSKILTNRHGTHNLAATKIKAITRTFETDELFCKTAAKPTHHDSITTNISGMLSLFEKIRNRSMQVF